METALQDDPPADLVSDLEKAYFWWEPVGSRSTARILAQAMEFASYADIRRIERSVDADVLVAVMTQAEPGWFSDRSWEFWRGRLSRASGRSIPNEPPRRALNAALI